jgi:hypothetical protein
MEPFHLVCERAPGSPTGPFEPGSTDFSDTGNNSDHGTQTGATSTSAAVTLSAPGSNPDSGGNANLNVDFGLFQPLSLGDTVWVDANNDGKFDNGEKGLANVVVALLDGSGNPVLDGSGNPITTTTDATGKYLFTGLTPGSYEVRITPPAGYVSSTGTPGSATGPYEPGSADFTDAGNNSDHGTQTGATVTSAPVTLTAPGTNPDSGGTANLNVDFGLVPLTANSTIRGSVFVDTNNNGQRDPGEIGIGGVSIILTGTEILGRSVEVIAVTDANGNFLFQGLLSGTYTLQEILPPGYLMGQTSPGNQGGSVLHTAIGSIRLGNNTDAIGYLFAELGRDSSGTGKRLFLNE